MQKNGLKEPGAVHVEMVDKLIFSEKPSARIGLAEDLQISRQYDSLVCERIIPPIETVELSCPGDHYLEDVGVWVRCLPAKTQSNDPFCFTVEAKGKTYVRCRRAGDTMRLSGGTKSLKKLFIDRKIPASQRCGLPVIADEEGVLGVYGIGANLERLSIDENAIEIRFLKKDER